MGMTRGANTLFKFLYPTILIPIEKIMKFTILMSIYFLVKLLSTSLNEIGIGQHYFFISLYSFAFGVKGQKLTRSILFYQNPYKVSVQIHNIIKIYILTNFAKHTSSFLGKFIGKIILFHCNFWLNLHKVLALISTLPSKLNVNLDRK